MEGGNRLDKHLIDHKHKTNLHQLLYSIQCVSDFHYR